MKRATQGRHILCVKKWISIHALVKRATVINDKQGNYESISIHALVKRATCDITTAIHAEGISIHALVKRATACIAGAITCSEFQSTPS